MLSYEQYQNPQYHVCVACQANGNACLNSVGSDTQQSLPLGGPNSFVPGFRGHANKQLMQQL